MSSLATSPAAAPAIACFDVRGEFDVSAVIAGAQRFCTGHGGSAVFAAHVATAASELANNLWMYAERGGQVRLSRLDRAGQRGVELVCEDDGPGIADPALALTEGWSSGGGMGCGLPGVRRLMDEFELDSATGRGTRVVARKWWQPPPLTAPPLLRRWAPGVASATLAMHDGEPCGDAALWLPAPGGSGADGLVAIIDGLGHGSEAARAAEAAVQCLQTAPDAALAPLPDLLRRLDRALAGLRGAAIGLVRVQGASLRHCGVGNTRVLRLRQEQTARWPSQNGVVGGGLPPHLLENAADLLPGDWLLLFTDGLDERLTLPVLLPEWARDPALLAEHLLHRHRLGRDDCGALVLRIGGD